MSTNRWFSWIRVVGLIVLLFATVGGGNAEPGMYLERTADGKYTPTFRVKEVVDTGTLVLENGISVRLAGIKGNHHNQAVAFAKKLVSKTKVALVSDRNVPDKNLFYVYLVSLDEEDLPFRMDANYASMTIGRGFLDLKIGFFDVSKAYLRDLNTILLRSGWAEVDDTQPFEHLSRFRLCEEDAKKRRRGLWAQ